MNDQHSDGDPDDLPEKTPDPDATDSDGETVPDSVGNDSGEKIEDEAAEEPLAEEDRPMTYGDIQNCMSELYAIATNLLKNEKGCHSRPSDLIQSFLIRYKVSDQEWEDVTWNNRAHFFNCAYLMMRRGLVRRARKRDAQRNPPIEYRDPAMVPLFADFPNLSPDSVIALDEALASLAKKDSELSVIIHHYYFGRLTYEETAKMMAISRKTVQRKLSLGRALLKKMITGGDGK